METTSRTSAWRTSFANQTKLRLAKKEAQRRACREYHRALRKDEIYGAAERERDRLRYAQKRKKVAKCLQPLQQASIS